MQLGTVSNMVPILTKQTQSSPRIGSQGIIFPLDPLSQFRRVLFFDDDFSVRQCPDILPSFLD